MALACTPELGRSRRCGPVNGVQRPKPANRIIPISFFLVVIVVTSQAQSAGADGACVARGNGRTAEWGTTCYEFFSEERNWFDARNFCHQFGGSLVSVTGLALQQWLESAIEQLLADRAGIWIGLNDRHGNGTYTWDDVNGTGREARYFNWVRQPNYGELGQSCVFMLKRFRWQWVNDECYSPYHGYSFACEFGSLPNVSMLTEKTNPDLALLLEHVTGTVGQVRSSRGAPMTSTTELIAERDKGQRNSTISESDVKDTALVIGVSVAVLLVFAAGLLSIVCCHYRRQLKRLTSAGSQCTFTTLAANNPLDDAAIDPRDQTLVTSNDIRAPLCTACGHRLEGRSREFSPYTQCITNDEHTYAQLVEPWLSSDNVGSLSNAVQPVSTGLIERQTENAHMETELLVNSHYSAPTCTVDGIDTLEENAYISVESVVDRCSKIDDRLLSPIAVAACNAPYKSDTTSVCYCGHE